MLDRLQELRDDVQRVQKKRWKVEDRRTVKALNKLEKILAIEVQELEKELYT